MNTARYLIFFLYKENLRIINTYIFFKTVIMITKSLQKIAQKHFIVYAVQKKKTNCLVKNMYYVSYYENVGY